MKKIFYIALLTVLLVYVSWAESVKPDQGSTAYYYQRTPQEGWWWYKDYVKEKKEQEKSKEETAKTEQTEKQPQPQKSKIKPLQEYTYEELLRMHPDEFKEIYDYYLKLAVQNPTEENVYNFYNILDVTRKKALLFTQMAGYVWQKYPELSTERDIPIVGPGITQQARLIRDEVRRYARENASGFGFIVFVSPGCPYCETQLRILDRARVDGIDIKVVDITKTPSAIETFGIEVTPTTIIVDRNTGQYMPVASGVVSLDEIYTRAERAIRLLRGEQPERYGLYEFQKGSSLDPLEPSPLWKKTEKNKKKGVR